MSQVKDLPSDPVPGLRAALAGLPQAEDLLLGFAADPEAPFVVTLTGPAGCGKTAVLQAFARVCRQHRIRVCGLADAQRILDDPGFGVLLIDDAQQIDTADLELVSRLAEEPGVRLALAYRPWPSQPALSALARGRPPVQLGHLDRPRLEDRVRGLLGTTPSPAVLEWLWARTAGLTRLVDQLVAALQDAGDLERPAPQAERDIIEQLRDELGALDPQVFRLLLARALGMATGKTDAVVRLAQVLKLEPAVVTDLTEEARASGLLDGDDSLVPLAHAAITARVCAASADPPALRGAAHRAETAALHGELDEALRLTDQVIADPAAPDRARGAMVAAAVLAHRGLLARSAELYQWMTSVRLATPTPLAAVALLGTGELDQARRVLNHLDGSHRPPTLLAGAESLMARGLLESVTGSPTAALSTLTRAAALLEPSGHTALLPDTPTALAGLVALHVGHFDVAESVLDRAVSRGLGGPLAGIRHRLLQGWTAMLHGDHPRAHRLLHSSVPEAGRLEPRDELLAAGLQVGLARREGNPRVLQDAWRRAKEAIVRHPVDLLTLLPLGELIVGAARVRERDWIAPHLAEAHALLDRLGTPPLWAAPLHWQGLHATITAQQPQEAKRHAEALAKVAQHGHYPAILAAAARCWLQVMAGAVDTTMVSSAARSLHAAGLAWEGSRLAGQAAIRNPDRKEVSTLLALARSLHSSTVISNTATSNAATSNTPNPAPAATRPAKGVTTIPTTGTPNSARSGPTILATGTANPVRGAARSATQSPPAQESARSETAGGTLTEREREIATLLLTNLTYKQIGERLYISAKTVEHHVARIRQRLGSDDRAELLTQLRTILG